MKIFFDAFLFPLKISQKTFYCFAFESAVSTAVSIYSHCAQIHSVFEDDQFGPWAAQLLINLCPGKNYFKVLHPISGFLGGGGWEDGSTLLEAEGGFQGKMEVSLGVCTWGVESMVRMICVCFFHFKIECFFRFILILMFFERLTLLIL